MGTTGKGTVSRSRKQKQALRDLGTPPKSAQKLSKSARAVTEQANSLTDRFLVVLVQAAERRLARERAPLVQEAARIVCLSAHVARADGAHQLANEREVLALRLRRLASELAREGGAP